MALTEYEQRQLQRLAEQLHEDDPRLAAKLEAASAPESDGADVGSPALTLLSGILVFAVAVGARISVLIVLGLAMIGTAVYQISSRVRWSTNTTRNDGFRS